MRADEYVFPFTGLSVGRADQGRDPKDEPELLISTSVIRVPYEIEATLARLECDRDVAMGMAVTGPELDALEALNREIAEAEDRRFLLGA